MNAFDYLAVIISIVLGLSLTQLLTDMERLLRERYAFDVFAANSINCSLRRVISSAFARAFSRAATAAADLRGLLIKTLHPSPTRKQNFARGHPSRTPAQKRVNGLR